MNFQPAYRLKLYRNFKALGANDFHGMVRYYEQNEDGIVTLDFEEYFDCVLLYTQALHEIGDFGKHVVMSDHLLELIIMNSIESWGGEDIYARVLLRKATSQFNLYEFAKAEHVLRELIKLHPRDVHSRQLLLHVLLDQKPPWLQKIRAVAVALTLIAALAIALEIFIVNPFFPQWFNTALVVHNIFLIGGILTFALGEWRHYFVCRKGSYGFANEMCKRKMRKAS